MDYKIHQNTIQEPGLKANKIRKAHARTSWFKKQKYVSKLEILKMIDELMEWAPTYDNIQITISPIKDDGNVETVDATINYFID